MKCIIPEISWHNREPVLGIDIQHNSKDGITRLATGGSDTHVVIWKVSVDEKGMTNVDFLADLTRHQKSVNVVRFSPNGELLATGDDEAALLIWSKRSEKEAPDLFQKEDDVQNVENWQILKILRGHVEDIYDLCWSPDSAFLISGSVDNSAIIWDVQKGSKVGILSEHKGFVQGVTWDPKNQYVATLSSDRTLRIYNLQTKKVVSRVSKANIPVPGRDNGPPVDMSLRLYYDDTLRSFCRRLCFTPDGELLITPAGLLEIPEPADEKKGGEESEVPTKSLKPKRINSTYVFSRQCLNRPAMYLPCKDSYTVAVRCCPVFFELRNKDASKSAIGLPYRIVYAVATSSSVLLYDTEQLSPFAKVGSIHYTRLSDLAWSQDGKILIVSSSDGYCSIITFAEGELGVEYCPENTQRSASEFTQSTPPSSQISGVEPLSKEGISDSPTARSELGQQIPSSAKVGRRIQLVTLSSPKSKKKLDID